MEGGGGWSDEKHKMESALMSKYVGFDLKQGRVGGRSRGDGRGQSIRVASE